MGLDLLDLSSTLNAGAAVGNACAARPLVGSMALSVAGVNDGPKLAFGLGVPANRSMGVLPLPVPIAAIKAAATHGRCTAGLF